MTLLFDLIYLLAVLLGWPYLIYRRITRGPGSTSLSERLGDVPSRPVAAQCVWIHAVSLGEVNATRTLVRDIQLHSPETVIVISSTTRTGLDQARRLYPKLTTFRFPLDFSLALRRVFERIRPTAVVLMELEVWPNLIEMAAARDVPVIIANGRVTEEKSMRRFNHWLLRPLARRMFGQLTFVAAQDAAHADRFTRLGVPPGRVGIYGSLKYDTAEVADRIDGQEALADSMTIDPRRPLWVCGSTGPGEEELILEAYARLRAACPALQLALIPRKPERFDEVADLVVRRGFSCLRRSGKPPLVPPGVAEPVAVFLGDTMGELRKFYGLATIVFVGRTLVPLGGSDVMEVAALGKPIVAGPHMENFAEAAELLAACGGMVQVSGAAELADTIAGLVADGARRTELGRRARGIVEAKIGATKRTVAKLFELMQQAS